MSCSLEVVEYSTLESGKEAERVVKALGGAGMIVVRNVPGVDQVRKELLPQARALALMADSERKMVLKENGLGTDVPLKRVDRLVSSFATQLRFSKGNEALKTAQEHNLGHLFRELGQRLVGLGTLVAKVCDSALPGLELESTILDSQTAKARLIHYHCNQERKVPAGKVDEDGIWQQWHYDYGVLTLVTGPMFFSGEQEVAAASGHSCLVAMDRETGLETFVSIPEDCVLVQVGEAAQIFSGGKLRATAHCVVRPEGTRSLDLMSRETFVVFLQPAWEKVLSCQVDGEVEDVPDISCLKMLPPLRERWKEGWSFAEFSKHTTGQYYGSRGIQSNKNCPTRC